MQAPHLLNKKKEQPVLLLNKAFFGKNNCLKITLNSAKECYFHFGTLASQGHAWNWKKVKFSDSELGSMILVLNKQKQAVSFFHSFNNDKTQIWVNRTSDYVFIKVKELSKQITEGEQEVMRILLDKIIWVMNS